MKIAVMGSGGWGTALALVLLENGHEVTLWSYREEESTILREKRENPMLKGVPLPDGLALTSDRECVKNCKVVVLAVLCGAYHRPCCGVPVGALCGAGVGVQGH